MPNMDCLLVMTNLPDAASADALARRLVDARLAACVNCLAPCRSVYRWNGRRRSRRGVSARHQNDASHLPGAGSRHPRSASLRTARDRRPADRAWAPCLSRLGRPRNGHAGGQARIMILRLLLLFALVFVRPALADEPLHPAIAFKPTLRAIDGQTIEVRLRDRARATTFYRDKFRFSAEPATIRLGAPVLPKGKEKVDDTFGKVEVYYREGSDPPAGRARQFGTAAAHADAHLTGLRRRRRLLSAAQADADGRTAGSERDRRPPMPAATNPDRSHAGWARRNYFWAGAAFFGFGLLLSLTPCVFPMIPILSGIIVGRETRQPAHFSVTRAVALRRLCFRHGNGLCGGRRRRRALRQPAIHFPANSLGRRHLCAGLRRAGGVDVRAL